MVPEKLKFGSTFLIYWYIMELKVWVDGVQRIVCGVTEATTCQEVVIALAQAIGKNVFGDLIFICLRSVSVLIVFPCLMYRE